MHPLGLVLFAIIALGSWYWWQAQPVDQRRSASWKIILLLVTIGLLYLAITGRMHWLGALIALVLPFLKQILPLLLRFFPTLARWWQSQQQKRQQGKTNHRQRKAGNRSSMTEAEALDILGLKSGASREDIIRAHRHLIQKLHPDRQGSAYLAARVNEARDCLLDE
ncbi:DnaJ domain-containing protein [Marinobacterium sediminicola]|uniref:DnaJ domain-containing protein n=1 Tax=Marinobacterium sediminicola TaxID=518898 RepID=A0ABY1RWG7_9GAMM|nr:DnaJ domain-containing protein [Marinobacterium sediminicola]ULG70352.1 DnaJ domain-containing protein [Marinobacterium sediminicola]SMR69631.1 DnaJ domain-containing protein [Marinobacterium sediminicola]